MEEDALASFEYHAPPKIYSVTWFTELNQQVDFDFLWVPEENKFIEIQNGELSDLVFVKE